MSKYKITQKQDMFYVYEREFFIFWKFKSVFGCLYNAQKEVEFLNTKEITVWEI